MDFDINSMDCLAALRPELRTVKYKGQTFYVRSLSDAADKELLAKTSLTGEITAAKLEKYYNELTRVIIMNGVVTAKGEPMFSNEKQYRRFNDGVDPELISLLESAVRPIETEAQKEQKDEQKK